MNAVRINNNDYYSRDPDTITDEQPFWDWQLQLYTNECRRQGGDYTSEIHRLRWIGNSEP